MADRLQLESTFIYNKILLNSNLTQYALPPLQLVTPGHLQLQHDGQYFPPLLFFFHTFYHLPLNTSLLVLEYTINNCTLKSRNKFKTKNDLIFHFY